MVPLPEDTFGIPAGADQSGSTRIGPRSGHWTVCSTLCPKTFLFQGHQGSCTLAYMTMSNGSLTCSISQNKLFFVPTPSSRHIGLVITYNDRHSAMGDCGCYKNPRSVILASKGVPGLCAAPRAGWVCSFGSSRIGGLTTEQSPVVVGSAAGKRFAVPRPMLWLSSPLELLSLLSA